MARKTRWFTGDAEASGVTIDMDASFTDAAIDEAIVEIQRRQCRVINRVNVHTEDLITLQCKVRELVKHDRDAMAAIDELCAGQDAIAGRVESLEHDVAMLRQALLKGQPHPHAATPCASGPSTVAAATADAVAPPQQQRAATLSARKAAPATAGIVGANRRAVQRPQHAKPLASRNVASATALGASPSQMPPPPPPPPPASRPFPRTRRPAAAAAGCV